MKFSQGMLNCICGYFCLLSYLISLVQEVLLSLKDKLSRVVANYLVIEV